MLDDHSKLEPPDPIPNSEVKRLSADGSVGLPHVRVGHRQASKYKTPDRYSIGRFLFPVLNFHSPLRISSCLLIYNSLGFNEMRVTNERIATANLSIRARY